MRTQMRRKRTAAFLLRGFDSLEIIETQRKSALSSCRSLSLSHVLFFDPRFRGPPSVVARVCVFLTAAMADTLHRIEVVSPELATLIRKVKAIYVVTGGQQRQTSSKSGAKSTFDMKRVSLMTHLDNIDRVSTWALSCTVGFWRREHAL